VTRDAGAARRRLPAPAKLNLGLRILGRRPDGYHELDSVFVPLDLEDEVELTVAEATRCEVTLALAGETRGVPADASNLAARAAAAFLEAAGLTRAVHVVVLKRIPAAAGLGGGSSDAGAVLRALSALHPAALPAPQLAALALRLGADVPYFLDPRPARVRGIGERIEPLAAAPARVFLLANPGVPLSTAAVFAAFDAQGPRPTAPRPVGFGARLANDLEPLAERLCPAIAGLRERLRGVGARAVGLSGSGPTVFGVFEDAATARRALARAAFEAPIWARLAAARESG
jgi:4-diphosphocytidyl-2-C-methyl-D-erythritol kinase